MELPNLATWFGTGNNISLGGDLPRRTILIRLDAKHARPWERASSEFRHANLRSWAAEHRGSLLAAAFTLAAAWIQEDRPEPSKAAPLGSFESWHATIGGILEVAGVDGFLADQELLYQEVDEEEGAWVHFLTWWSGRYGEKAMALADVYSTIERGLPLPPGVEWSDRNVVKKAGNALRTHKDRRYPTAHPEPGVLDRLPDHEDRSPARGAPRAVTVRAAIYSRYSTDRQRESSTTEQVAECRAYAKAHGMEVIEDLVVEERGISGATRVGRPKFMWLVGDMIAEWDVLLAWDTARLGREQEDVHWLKNRVAARRKRVVVVSQGRDFDDLAVQIEALADELTRKKVAADTRRPMKHRAGQGLTTGGLPYGYQSDGRARHASQREAPARAASIRRVRHPTSRSALASRDELGSHWRHR